jgi:type IV secretory pathway VirB9-like protein
MAKLSGSRRKKLPASSFVYPKKKAYPIDTPGRARNALARAANPNNAGSYAAVEKKVNRKYPQIATKHHKPKKK